MGISREEALDCFESDDLIGLGMEADAVRRKLHPEGVVSYAVCGRIESGPSTEATLLDRIGEAAARGASGVTFGCESAGSVEQAEALLRVIKGRFPNLWLHCFPAGEVLVLAQRAGTSVRDTITRLRDAGLGSIPGDRAASTEGQSWKSSDWFAVHRTAHELGLPTTAAMVFGQSESLEQRVSHLEALRQLQEQTGGFTSFLLRASAARGAEEPTAVEYLKTLAISRIVLDNFANIEIDVNAQGLKVFETCLRFGGNDAGTLRLSANEAAATDEQLRFVIRDAGFRPVERDLAYRMMFLN